MRKPGLGTPTSIYGRGEVDAQKGEPEIPKSHGLRTVEYNSEDRRRYRQPSNTICSIPLKRSTLHPKKILLKKGIGIRGGSYSPPSSYFTSTYTIPTLFRKRILRSSLTPFL